MPIKIVLWIAMVMGILLIMMIFSNHSPEVPVVVMETEFETDTIKIAESIDSVIMETSAIPTESIVQEADSSLDKSESISQSSSTGLSSEERENNAMLIREQRKEGMLQYREYNRLRREWRKELNVALHDARESSDYTYYNELKSNPPDKSEILLGF